MEPDQTNNPKLVEDGMKAFEETQQFRLKVTDIKLEVKEKYALILSSESNWLKRLVIKLRMQIEIGRRVSQLSSGRNLHAATVDLA